MSIELLQASTHGDITAVLALLDAAGVDLEARLNGVGWTALMFAAADGHDEVVRLLLGAGADIHLGGHAAVVRLYNMVPVTPSVSDARATLTV